MLRNHLASFAAVQKLMSSGLRDATWKRVPVNAQKMQTHTSVPEIIFSQGTNA